MGNPKIIPLTTNSRITKQLGEIFHLSAEDVMNLSEGIVQLKNNDTITLEQGHIGLLFSGALQTFTLYNDPATGKQEKQIHCLICNDLFHMLCPVVYNNQHIRNLVEGTIEFDESECPCIQATKDSVVVMLNLSQIYSNETVSNFINFYYRQYPFYTEKIDAIKSIPGISERMQKIKEYFPTLCDYYSHKTIASFFSINYDSWKKHSKDIFPKKDKTK